MVQLGQAIDFRKLLKEERARAARKNNEGSPTTIETTTTTTTTAQLPPWKSSVQSLSLTPLDRTKECVSSNPPSIFYRQHCLPESYCQDLQQWLEALPHADNANKNTDTSTTSTGNSNTPQSACWHSLLHARRQVAMFYTTTTTPQFPEPLEMLVTALEGIFYQDSSSDNNNDNNDTSLVFHRPNHILVNRYTESQGILPHTDGPAYQSRTATFSLGQGDVLLDFVPRWSTAVSKTDDKNDEKNNNDKNKSNAISTTPTVTPQLILHGGGSLVVFEEEAYLDYMHSIAEILTTSNNTAADGSSLVQYASDQCRNAPPGTRVERQTPRISLTIRHKKVPDSL